MRRTVLLATLLLLACAAPAAARDTVVRSFDGTKLHVSFHPAKAGKRAPTILMTHGWGGTRERSPDGASSAANAGTAALRKAGFNVLTWDSRGFGDSSGTVTIDYRKNEGRDVRVLLDWLARRPEAKLDRKRDPRVGMHGGSYAGGIQFVAAAIDRRIDAIAPSIAWHSLVTSLYRAETVKGGWSSALYAAGQSGRLDPHITSAFATGAGGGTLSAEDRAWFASRGPGALVKRIKVPTLILQGTPDTLFTPSEAIDNYRILRSKGVPVKMLWFCGGHGTCLTGEGTAGHLERRVIAWLQRYVMRRKNVKTGPGFEWLADDAVWRSARALPAEERHAGGRRGLRHAGGLARRHAVGLADRGNAGDQRGQCRDPGGDRAGRRPADRAPDLLRHRDGDARVRPDRRRDAQRRARQPGHADPGQARRRVAHRHPRARGRGGQPGSRAALPAAADRRHPGLRAGTRAGGDHVLGGADRAADYFSLKRFCARKTQITDPAVPS